MPPGGGSSLKARFAARVARPPIHVPWKSSVFDRTHPGAAASLREGMAETLTVLRLGIPPTLARTFRSTNAVECMISICRTHASNVKNWRDGTMGLRWCAAGMVEASKQFRRVNGHMHLRSLRDTLERVTQPVGATGHADTVTAA
jgi:putative transposase